MAVVDRRVFSSLLLLALQISILLKAHLLSRPEICLSSKLVAEAVSIYVSILHKL